MNFELNLWLSALPAGQVFSLDRQTLISIGIQLFNALVLALALGFILYEPVRSFMKKRSERISGQLESAKDRLAEAEALKLEYEKKLGNIDIERIHILEEARKNAADRTHQILEHARDEAAEVRQRVQRDIANEKQRLKEETRLYIVEVSSAMAGKFVEYKIDSQTQDRLFEETMAELEEVTWQN